MLYVNALVVYAVSSDLCTECSPKKRAAPLKSQLGDNGKEKTTGEPRHRTKKSTPSGKRVKAKAKNTFTLMKLYYVYILCALVVTVQAHNRKKLRFFVHFHSFIFHSRILQSNLFVRFVCVNASGTSSPPRKLLLSQRIRSLSFLLFAKKLLYNGIYTKHTIFFPRRFCRFFSLFLSSL